ncbi:uncharacterized protein N7498_006847, partial [Penicillium cinerascens]
QYHRAYLETKNRARGFAVNAMRGSNDDGVGGPLMEYDARIGQGRLQDDPHQRQIIKRLQDLYEELKTYDPPQVTHPTVGYLDHNRLTSYFESFLGRGAETHEQVPAPGDSPKGLYMFGGVGCGKTMLMDMFYETLPAHISCKSRTHFHNFMQEIHKRLNVLKIESGSDCDALSKLAADIAEESSVLCFDEFQCADIADAMILRTFLGLLVSHGVVLVMTSNSHPDDLYTNGIQRESFIPCIELLKDVLKVTKLSSHADYRQVARPQSGAYYHPLGPKAEQHVQKWFSYLGDINDPPNPTTKEIWGREIKVPMASGKAVRFSFKDLVGDAVGTADYLELVQSYDSFIVTEVPQMDLSNQDPTKRFITFIDAIYESKAILVLTTAVPPSKLFLGLSMEELRSTSSVRKEEERFAYMRAMSRLSEIGSEDWMKRKILQE